jgi:uncharacterized damage-inducible protein DinB
MHLWYARCRLHVEDKRMDLLDRLLGHDRWATNQFLEMCRELTDAQLDQPFDIGHATLRETLEHMNFAVGLWTALMTGHPALPERGVHRPLAEMIECHEQSYDAFATFARRARDERLLNDTFVDHHNNWQSVGSTLLQVTHHNAQHRGEVRHILERLGVPGMWDYDPQEWEHLTQGIPYASSVGQEES